jgi:hypothetical protein
MQTYVCERVYSSVETGKAQVYWNIHTDVSFYGMILGCKVLDVFPGYVYF